MSTLGLVLRVGLRYVWFVSAFPMQVLSTSTLGAYARLFWRRQAAKVDPNDQEALADICLGGDPVDWLRRSYPYKLPDARNAIVTIVRIETREELYGLLVHDYVPCDDWMRARNVTPEPFTRKLGQLARTFLDRGYFASPQKRSTVSAFLCVARDRIT